MNLAFQEVTDGFRVVAVDEHGRERQMIAHVQTKRATDVLSVAMTDAEFEARSAAVGVTAALQERDAANRTAGTMVTKFVPLPNDECTIHSAGGPLTFEVLQEIMNHVRNS